MDETLQARLRALESAGQYRDPEGTLAHRACVAAAALGVPLLDAASNDTLGFAGRPLPPHEAYDVPAGAGASRLVHGTHSTHRDLERAVAAWLGTEDALLFNSGYAANLGAISALAQAGDLVVSDRLNHASLVDGCRLSKAEIRVAEHAELSSFERALKQPCRGQRWLVVESYYSMDGDSPDLVALRELATRYDAAFVVDEAHALGVFGPEGRGKCAASGVRADVLTGGFGKAFGLSGGWVASSAAARSWLWNRARSFVYSTGSSPALASAVLTRLAEVQRADDRRDTLAAISQRVRARLETLPDVNLVQSSHGPICPLLLGTEQRALLAAERFADRGILVQAIRPPTVPPQSSRIRLTLKATFTTHDIERLLAAAEATCAP